MVEPFDKVLDQCIDQLMSGRVTVEECLARHPEHAAELESHLQVASRLLVAASYAPSAGAKNRGRQRLQAEMAELRRRDTGSRVGRPGMIGVFRLRPWATALAGLVLALFIGGPTVVAASGRALPGDGLYTVKRGFEETRLAFQFSQVGKADLYLAFSQRRAEELSRLVANGETDQIMPTQKKLNAHLRAVARIAQSLEDDRELESMRSKLDTRASKSLASMQAALGGAPPVSRSLATDSFQASSEAFGVTVEKVAAQTPKRVEGKAQGHLLVIAAEPAAANAAGVDQVLVQVNRIEVHRAGDQESSWKVLSSDAVVIDLLRIATIGNVLGRQPLEPGTYSKIRLWISDARIVSNGVEQPAVITNNVITFTRPFRVEEQETAVVFLDFDSARSVEKTSQGAYILSPVVRVLTGGAPGQNRDEDKSGKDSASERGKGQGRGADKGPTLPESRSGGVEKVEVVGPITRIETGLVAVDGKQVIITPDTVIESTPRLGDRVAVQAVVGADGVLAATRITVEKKDNEGKGKSSAAGSVGPAQQTGPDRKEESKPGKEDRGKGGAGTTSAPAPDGSAAPPGARVQIEGAQGPGNIVNAARIPVLGSGPGSSDSQSQPPAPTPRADEPASPHAESRQQPESQPSAEARACVSDQVPLPKPLPPVVPANSCP